MEDRRDHRVSVALIALALLLLQTASAKAQSHDDDQFDFESTTVVDTNNDAVVVEGDAQATILGAGGSSGGSSGCWLDPVGTIGEIFVDSFEEQWSNPDLMPYLLWCGDEMRGLVWLDTSGGSAAPALDPETIAMHIRDEIPVPDADIRINPDRGLVGVDSWFWIEGYDGAPIEESTDAFGQTVEVEARVTSYEWAFGDGDTIEAGTPGRPYPHRSQIRHVYERSSAGLAAGYIVEVTFTFEVRYRVDGGGWLDLPGITRFASTSYPVRESQAVIQQ
jgi:hypothetical protein